MECLWTPESERAEVLMRSVLRDGAEIAGEYPLVFDKRFDGGVVTAGDEANIVSTCAVLSRRLKP